jgi:hypothetical protein
MYSIKIKLLSDTTFGRGDGVAGLVDQEVEHDQYGFPFLRGRTLKGLLSEECDNLVILLPEGHQRNHWLTVRHDLFGQAGSTSENMAKMHVGDACLPEDLRYAVAKQQLDDNILTREDILNSLTAIRKQTAIDPKNGVAADHSLRSLRVIVRDRPEPEFSPSFQALLFFEEDPTTDMLAALGVVTLALRRIGTGRNRGLGHVQCTLHYKEENITRKYIENFGKVK